MMRAPSPMRAPDAGVVERARFGPKGVRAALLRLRNERHVEDQVLVQVRRMPVWQSSLLALGGLVFVLGIALAEMAGIGELLHSLDPARQFDVYYALHSQLVVGSLIGVSLLWLLPPHPWAKRLVEAADREEPAEGAGEGRSGAPGMVTALSLYQDRGPPLGRAESEEVGS